MQTRSLRRSAALLLAGLCAGVTAASAQPTNSPAGVEACQACHGRDGVSASPAIPNLAGQKSDYLAGQLAAFKSGARKNELMQALAGQLSDADIKALAKFWSGLPPTPAAAPAPVAIRSRMVFPANFPAGFTLYTRDGEGTISERYANAVALRAARAGQPLPNGSVIFVVNRAAEKDASGAVKPGAIQSYTGMEARDGWGAVVPSLLRNGDWDYAVFDAKGVRRDGLNEAQCMACHKPAAADSFVFTMKALRAAAAKPPS